MTRVASFKFFCFDTAIAVLSFSEIENLEQVSKWLNKNAIYFLTLIKNIMQLLFYYYMVPSKNNINFFLIVNANAS